MCATVILILMRWQREVHLLAKGYTVKCTQPVNTTIAVLLTILMALKQTVSYLSSIPHHISAYRNKLDIIYVKK